MHAGIVYIVYGVQIMWIHQIHIYICIKYYKKIYTTLIYVHFKNIFSFIYLFRFMPNPHALNPGVCVSCITCSLCTGMCVCVCVLGPFGNLHMQEICQDDLVWAGNRKNISYYTRLWVYFVFSLLTSSTGHTGPNILYTTPYLGMYLNIPR